MAVVADDGRHAEPPVLRAPPLTSEQVADLRQRWKGLCATAGTVVEIDVVLPPRPGLALTVTARFNRFKRWLRRQRRRFAR